MLKIKHLAGMEKDLLSEALRSENKLIGTLGTDRPIAQAMVDQGILFHPEGHFRDFAIEEWVWKLINEHPELLK